MVGQNLEIETQNLDTLFAITVSIPTCGRAKHEIKTWNPDTLFAVTTSITSRGRAKPRDWNPEPGYFVPCNIKGNALTIVMFIIIIGVNNIPLDGDKHY